MNYIKQLNAYWKRRQLNPLSSGVSDLYMALLNFANMTGWKKQFNVPNQMLSATCGVEKSELYRRRQRLISTGLIHYMSGRKGTAGKYTIIPLYNEGGGNMYPTYGNTSSINPLYGNNPVTIVGNNEATNPVTNVGNIHKEKQNKNRNAIVAAATDTRCVESSNESVRIMELWQKAGFGVMSPMTMEALLSYLEGGMDVECILYAIEQANANNARSLAYVRSILKRLQDDGITTKSALDADKRTSKDKESKKAEDLPEDDYFRLHNSWDEI